MRSAPQLAYAHIGQPEVDGCVAHQLEPCAMCAGESTQGMLVENFLGISLTDQNSFRAPHSEHVCAACVFVRRRLSPVVGREPKPCDRCNGTGQEPEQAQARKGNRGKRAPGQPCAKCDGTGRKESAGRWSNFTHLWDGHTLDNATKGEKPKILAFLRRMATPNASERGTWFAAISDTGQKHILPYTPVNLSRGAGGIRFEEQTVALPTIASPSWELVSDTTQLLTDGATKEEIERGAYGPFAYARCRAAIERYEQRWAALRGLPWFALSLWLSQRDEEAVVQRKETEKGKRSGKTHRTQTRQDPHGAGGVHPRSA